VVISHSPKEPCLHGSYDFRQNIEKRFRSGALQGAIALSRNTTTIGAVTPKASAAADAARTTT
jgi:hypothetical protein